MRIVDLTQKIQAGMPVYPGDPDVQLELARSHGKDICQTTAIKMGSHAGTHIDAPRHFYADKASLTDLPLDTFVGDAICIRARISHPQGPGTRAVLDLSTVERRTIKQNDRVILSTGWEEKAGTDEYYDQYPIFSAELITFLLSMEIRLLGVDMPTIEAVDTVGDPFAMHRILLSRGIVPVEGLVNLPEIVGQRFFFSAAPLPFENGDGSPIRAYAMIEEE